MSDWKSNLTISGINTKWVAGKYGCGINFSGLTYASVNSTILNSSASITISAWVNTPLICNNTSNECPIANKCVGSDTSQGYRLSVYQTIGLRFAIGNGSEQPIDCSLPVIANMWNYVAGVYNNSNQTLFVYLNGVQCGSKAIIGSMQPSSNPFYIGFRSDWNRYYNGTIDEVKVWNRALSPEEIYLDYLGSYANIEKYYQSLTQNNIINTNNLITSLNNNMSNNFTTLNNNLSSNFSTLDNNLNSNFTILNNNMNSNFSVLNNNLNNNFSTLNDNLYSNFANTNNLIIYLNNNMSSNFTYLNGRIALVLDNITLVLGNETEVKNLINSLANITAQEIWEYPSRTANCSNCSAGISLNDLMSVNNTIQNSWGYENRTEEIAERIWNYEVRTANCLNCTGGNNTYYQNFTTFEGAELTNEQLKNISKYLYVYSAEIKKRENATVLGYSLPFSMDILFVGIFFLILCGMISFYISYAYIKRGLK